MCAPGGGYDVEGQIQHLSARLSARPGLPGWAGSGRDSRARPASVRLSAHQKRPVIDGVREGPAGLVLSFLIYVLAQGCQLVSHK